MTNQKIVIAITGASGSIYAQSIVNKLYSHKELFTRADVVITDNAKTVWEAELGNRGFETIPFNTYANNDFFAPFASGSAGYNCMIIVPCSMGILGRIAGGISNDLITRAADVILKERHKLICVVRETPYNLIHIKNMEAVTVAGGIICPATPSFYSKPATIEAVAETVTDRVLQLAGLHIKHFEWGDK